MRTILPRAAVATVVASALGVGVFLFPLDASGLIGDSSAERGARELDALVAAVYPRPGRIDVDVPRVPDRDGLPAGAGHAVLAAEMLEVDGTYSPPELLRALHVVRSLRALPHSGTDAATGRRVEGRALPLSPEDLLELVVLVENFLQSMARTPEPDLAELLTNVLATVADEMKAPVAAAVTAPPPAAGAAVPQAPTVAPIPVPAVVEPASEPPELEPSAAPAAPMPTPQQVNPTPVVPSVDVVGAGHPPPAEVTSQPSPAVDAESDEETAVGSQPELRDPAEPGREPDKPDLNTNDVDPQREAPQNNDSTSDNGADSQSSSQDKDASNE